VRPAYGSPPRAWGKVLHHRPTFLLRGSPPRAWGKGLLGARVSGRPGFTPTGVGKSDDEELYAGYTSVHPHGRGEKTIRRGRTGPCRGSPPRAWGKADSSRPRHRAPRFTPTGVGKSARAFRSQPWGPVHPHGRGEKAAGVSPSTTVDGSPPRAWGKGWPPPKAGNPSWFTPTGVGKRVVPERAPGTHWVHPHGRGEKSGGGGGGVAHIGSPPRAWGKAARDGGRDTPARFTPTGVGKRIRSTSPREPFPVHPHGRGEKLLVSGTS